MKLPRLSPTMEPTFDNNDVAAIVAAHKAAGAPCILVRRSCVFVVRRLISDGRPYARVLRQRPANGLDIAGAHDDTPEGLSAHDCVSLLHREGFSIVHGNCNAVTANAGTGHPCYVCHLAAGVLPRALVAARNVADTYRLMSGFGLVITLRRDRASCATWAVKTQSCVACDGATPLEQTTWFYTRQMADWYMDCLVTYGFERHAL